MAALYKLTLVYFVVLLVLKSSHCDDEESIDNILRQMYNAQKSAKSADMSNPNTTERFFKAVGNIPTVVSDILKNSSSPACSYAWNTLSKLNTTVKLSAQLNYTLSRKYLAIDAAGKPNPGILKGNLMFNGYFDECMAINTSSLNFSMDYCDMVFVIVEINYVTYQVKIFPAPFTEGLCIPDVCSFDDMNATFWKMNNKLIVLKEPIIIAPASVYSRTSQNGIPFNAGAYVMIIISFIFVFLAALGTTYDILLPYIKLLVYKHPLLQSPINDSGSELHSEKEPLLVPGTKVQHKLKCSRLKDLPHDLLKCFSLYTTVPAVLSTVQPSSAITSINGMRVISMFWVILGHSYVFLLMLQSGGYKDFVDIQYNFAPRFSAQPILNGFFSVDSFFFLGGLLVAYLTFREMNRSNGRFPFLTYYIHRFLRLTPTYMYVLFFFWFLSVHITVGPNTLFTLGPESSLAKNCKDYWWTNLLYINNFYPIKFTDECMGWTWYLANDMQFYVISPLLLIPLYYWLPGGLMAVGTLLAASIGVTGFIAGYYKYPANTFYPLFTGKDVPPAHRPTQDTEIYGKPYCRISPYLVGIVLGYVLFKKYSVNVNKVFNLLFHGLLWVVAGGLGIASVYGLYSSFHGHKFTAADNVSYFMFSRLSWGVALALVVFVCHNGYGGVVNRFLSLPMWIPLSRMTFNAYLVHEIILLVLFSEMREGMYYTDLDMVVHVLANVVLSYGAAAVITVFVEFPLSNLEVLIFKLLGKPLRSSARTAEKENRQ